MLIKNWLILLVYILILSARAGDFIQSFGTALVISNDGYLLAENRAVGSHKSVTVVIADKSLSATVIKKDEKTGFAILKIETDNLLPLSFVDMEKLVKQGGISGRVAGFPPDPVCGSEIKSTQVWVSLTKDSNNARLLQVHARPIPGSDGYPIIDGFGNIIGFMRSSLGKSQYYSINALPNTDVFAMLKDAGVKINIIDVLNNAVNEVELKKKLASSIVKFSIPATADSKQIINVKTGVVMVKIPGGDFTMGSKPKEGNPDEEPQQIIKIDEFWIDKYEVTLGQYKKFCEDTKRPLPELPEWAEDNKPIVNVTWQDAADYAKWRGGSLPTEAQWEKAARGTDARPFPWGTAPTMDWSTGFRMSGAAMGRGTGAQAAATFEIGESPYGAQDMAGNAWEWCVDWYQPDAYKTMGKINPAGPEKGADKVIRGGSWFTTDTEDFRCASRGHLTPTQHNYFTGFRCVYGAQKIE